MANPYLPNWEYIPDGEPRVFGDRIYVYGSHDRAGSDQFCDYVLKCWSAPVNDPGNWVCHGDIFRTGSEKGRPADTEWTGKEHYLFAPDVVEKDGKYFLFAYIVNSKGCVAVSDRPEGPFKLLSQYEYTISDEICCNGWFIDPGVLVDDDGRVYIYCGFERSFLAEVNPEKMWEIKDGSCIEHFIPVQDDPDHGFVGKDTYFFEAASPRKLGSKGFEHDFELSEPYYMIYSPKRGSRLAYATSASPTGPFRYRGYIVDNGVDYPGGNDHGSIAKIDGQWYVFYHRMTNGTIMSRRGCVERIEILPDGTIPPVEMTSLGFEKTLNPYKITPADIACVLKNTKAEGVCGSYITERNLFERVITNITDGTVIGYKYFDFGEDYSFDTMFFALKYRGFGADATLHILADSPEGDEIGSIKIGHEGGYAETEVKKLTGVHAIYFKISTDYSGWTAGFFENRNLLEISEFAFMK